MSKITTINEPWDGHDYPEVEAFVKESLVNYKKRVESLLYDKFPERRPLTFEAAEDEVKVYFNCFNENEQTRTVEVSIDGGETWKSFTSENYDYDDNAPIASLNAGQTALVRGDNEAMGYYSEDDNEVYNGGSFRIVGRCYVYGNVMSLLDSERFYEKTAVGKYAFYSLFFDVYNEEWANRNTLLSHPKKHLLLPATTLAERCYDSMFECCSSLMSAPSLPATVMADGCYSAMFCECESLVTTPELPAMTLAEHCYDSMFYNCSSLVTSPVLPATTLEGYCYDQMFLGCNSLVIAPALSATTLAEYCYRNMFSGCSSLKSTPTLNIVGKLENGHISGMFRSCNSLTDISDIRATEFDENCLKQMFKDKTSIKRVGTIYAATLGKNCCYEMFANCTALESVQALPATTLASYCYNAMFKGCTSLVNVPAELPATTLKEGCYLSMFSGCTSLVSTPVLPATVLKGSCYSSMFKDCTSLNYVKAMFLSTPGSYTTNWLLNVSATGTFVRNSAANWNVTGANGIPTGWTVERADA